MTRYSLGTEFRLSQQAAEIVTPITSEFKCYLASGHSVSTHTRRTLTIARARSDNEHFVRHSLEAKGMAPLIVARMPSVAAS
jgi:hypothetical protein